MPEIPKEALESASQVIKVADLKLEEGDRYTFKIAGPHIQNANGLYSIPVENSVNGKNHFGLNKTNLKTLCAVLGNNSDTWKGASFECIVVSVNNPQTKAPTLSWKIVEKSIKPKK